MKSRACSVNQLLLLLTVLTAARVQLNGRTVSVCVLSAPTWAQHLFPTLLTVCLHVRHTRKMGTVAVFQSDFSNFVEVYSIGIVYAVLL